MTEQDLIKFKNLSMQDGRLNLQWFADYVAQAEREKIMDEWWMCVQSDLENGVKSLNEEAAKKWRKEYPAIAGFSATIEARSKE